jgi:hypothetical protein
MQHTVKRDVARRGMGNGTGHASKVFQYFHTSRLLKYASHAAGARDH